MDRAKREAAVAALGSFVPDFSVCEVVVALEAVSRPEDFVGSCFASACGRVFASEFPRVLVRAFARRGRLV